MCSKCLVIQEGIYLNMIANINASEIFTGDSLPGDKKILNMRTRIL